jgi:transposase
VILKAEDMRGQALDHLGLVTSVISRLQLVKKIDARLPVSKEKGAKVTMGQRVAAMVLNGLGFTDDRLYLFPDFLKNKPVERLLGPGLKASDFNDDITGRCLDEITNYGTTPFFTEIAFEIGLAENLLGPSAHFDTTSLTVYGEYENDPIDVPESKIDKDFPFIITHGHSKAHRPDLKQMILNLATTGSGFPIWMEAHSGNASDKKILEGGANRMRSFCEKLKSAPSFLYVGDSAFYERCVKEKVLFKWLSRVPERLNETKRWVERPDEDFTWSSLGDGYKMTPLFDAGYGDVSQRWVMIHSEKAATREYKTLEKNIKKEADAVEKKLWHLSNQTFKCSHDAEISGQQETKKLKYHQVSWVLEPVEGHIGRGRPKQGASPVTQGYRIKGTIEEDKGQIELIKRRKGRFILASNELEQAKLSELDFLSEYKNQYKTEQSFAFIKGDAFEVASVFLKKPSRIQALMVVMTLCLMVYSFAQQHLRKALVEANETIPDQLKNPTMKPTMAWVFRLFQGIQVWLVPHGGIINELVVNLTALTQRIIGYFGPVAEEIYSSTG